jgi:asparagine synthase (glutamine-hydrolysing)
LRPAALEDYLTFGMVPGQTTIFEQIEKLPPAHTLLVAPDRLDASSRRYWSLRLAPDPKPSPQEWQESVRAKIDVSVRLHMIADVPVGAFLSGGVDSSVIVAASSGLTQGRLQTFSMGFAEAAFSELPFARQVAQHYGTQHLEEIVTPDAASILGELTRYYDEPFADSSAIPTFLVSKLAGRHVKVVLSGDGGDEAFGGYARYAHDLKEATVRNFLPRWLRRWAISPVAHVWPKTDWLPRRLRARTFLTNISLDPGAAYANTLSWCRPPLRRQLLAPDVAQALNGWSPERRVQTAYAAAPAGDALAGMIAADIDLLLPDDYLVKVDRASMAHGLEVRPPLLDHELLELTARIPSALKVRRGETKWLFKQAYEKQLPPGIMRRPKQGFEIPIDAWLRGPLFGLFHDAVLQTNSSVHGLIDKHVVQKLCQAHQRGLGRHGQVLWSILVLARWADRYLRPNHAHIPACGIT